MSHRATACQGCLWRPTILHYRQQHRCSLRHRCLYTREKLLHFSNMLIAIKVSKTTKVTLQALHKKEYRLRKRKRKLLVFRRFLKRKIKTQREGDVMTCCAKLFHTHDAATGNDQSPILRRVRRTTCIDDDAE